MGFLVLLVFAQTAFQGDPFQPLEDYAPSPSPSRTPFGTPSAAYWQNRADYQMEISINPQTHQLRGTARLIYTHNAPFSICYLWMAIEPNYFSLRSYGHLSRNFLWEDFRRDALRSRARRAELYARQLENYQKADFRLLELAWEEGSRLTPLSYRIEETLMEVALPRCLSAGETIVLRMSWQFRLNDALVEGRGGYMLTDEGPIYQVAQYYPRPVLLTDIRGWQKMPYYGPSEFATEFGDFEVFIRIPKGYIVAATGRLLNPEAVLSPPQLERWRKAGWDSTVFVVSSSEVPLQVEKEESVWHFKAENVRDFAFAASRQYIWEVRYTRISGTSHPTLLQSFYTSEVAPLWKYLAVGAAEHALHEYSRYTIPFPYPSMSVTYGGVGGMEYPMIVFCGRQKVEKDGSYTEAARHAFISLVIHEVGHNFFPMIVSSDERRWMWLDEGLNTYLENLSKRTFEPLLRKKEEEAERQRVRDYIASGRSQSILAHPLSIREMGANAYLKVAAGLETLREYILDPPRMDTAFQRYARIWAFKHPEPWDFFRVVSNAVSQELGWFWKGWFLDTKAVDIGIDTLIQERILIDRQLREHLLAEEQEAAYRYLEWLARDTVGASFYVDRHPSVVDKYVQANRALYEAERREKRAAFDQAKAAAEKFLKSEERVYEVRVLFRNWGGQVWPLWVKLTYRGGGSSLWYFPAESWAKDQTLLLKVFYTRRPVERVEVDPWQISLDIHPENQVYGVPSGD
ncbi:MAG: M1 family metallopeptidase [Bacteroidia bacterium]|nr:M1 family metallopeptidase [Bacteroidia bacterium]MDW8015733.1 M1 family metallopeptidase [Bacteroidia bacterium]